VGSIARSGAGSEAVDVILERLLPRYPRIQAIIILVGVSDVFRWLEHGAPPSPPPQVRTSELFMCHPEGPFGWKPRELALVELLLRMRRLWLRWRAHTTARQKSNRRRSNSRASWRHSQSP